MIPLDSPIMIVTPAMSSGDYSRSLLRECGFSIVHKTHNSADAMVRLSEENYACVIGFANMMPISWRQFMRHIRRNKRSKKMPALLISNDSRRRTVMSARDLGVNGYLLTPYSINGLRDAVLRLWNNTLFDT